MGLEQVRWELAGPGLECVQPGIGQREIAQAQLECDLHSWYKVSNLFCDQFNGQREQQLETGSQQLSFVLLHSHQHLFDKFFDQYEADMPI